MARNQSEVEEEAKPLLQCPACGHTEFLFIEPYVQWYSTQVVDGVLQILGHTSDGEPDSTRDSVLECEACSRQIPIPHNMDWEWS